MDKKTAEQLIASEFKGKILFNEYLKNHTTMKVGGKASLFLLPEDEESVKKAVEFCKKQKTNFYILGGGSNIIFNDRGFDGAVICTEELNKIRKNERSIVLDTNEQKKYNLTFVCQCGAKTSFFSEDCVKNNIAGFEAFSGLPGSIGGACFMNARCYGDEFSNHIKAVEYLDLETMELCNYEFNANDWNYKKSPFQNGKKIILNVEITGLIQLEKNSEKAKELKMKAAEYMKNREDKGHFKYPSAGSVFKNNHDFGKPSGAIIDECGLKGLSEGEAQVAPWHGNFIINNGNATAEDIKKLVQKIQKKVEEFKGFKLEPEVIFV